jgi:hypothetical protein
MEVKKLHGWSVNKDEAEKIQDELKKKGNN